MVEAFITPLKNEIVFLNSILDSNAAWEDGGGIYNGESKIYGSKITLHNSSVIDNTAGKRGGGIFNGKNNIINLTDSLINENKDSGVHNNGELILNNSDISRNSVTDIGNWGTIELVQGETNESSGSTVIRVKTCVFCIINLFLTKMAVISLAIPCQAIQTQIVLTQ